MADSFSADDMCRLNIAPGGAEGIVPLCPSDMEHPEVRKAATIALLADVGLFGAAVAGPALLAAAADTIEAGLGAAGRAILKGFQLSGESESMGFGERLRLLGNANGQYGRYIPIEDKPMSWLVE